MTAAVQCTTPSTAGHYSPRCRCCSAPIAFIVLHRRLIGLLRTALSAVILVSAAAAGKAVAAIDLASKLERLVCIRRSRIAALTAVVYSLHRDFSTAARDKQRRYKNVAYIRRCLYVKLLLSRKRLYSQTYCM